MAILAAAAVEGLLSQQSGGLPVFFISFPVVALVALSLGGDAAIFATLVRAALAIVPGTSWLNLDPAYTHLAPLSVFLTGGVLLGAVAIWQTRRRRTAPPPASLPVEAPAQQQAEDARHRYQLLADHSRDIILFVRRKDTRILEANAAALAAYGYTRQEILALTIHQLRAPGTESLTSAQMAQAAAGGVLFETIHRRKDGSTFPVEVGSRGTLLGGEVVLISVVRDITQRRQDEALTLANLSRMELLAATAGELLQSREPQQLVERLCRQVMEQLDCQAFFNFLVDAVAGRLHLNACAGVPPEEARRIEWLDYGSAVCGCVAREGQRIVAEHICTTHDPRTDLVRSYGIRAYACHPLLGPGGEVLGTLSFGTRTRDVFSESDLALMKAVAGHVAVAMARMRGEGALAMAMQRLDAHMDNSPLGVIEWGPDMRLTRWSKEAENIFGWKAHEVLGKRLGEFRWVHELDAEKVADVSEQLQHGIQRFSANRNYRKDGSVVQCHWYNSTLVDDGGVLRSILSLVQDVTEQNRTQQALQDAKALAEQASRAKDQFIAVLSHELRTPLTPAVAALALLRTDVRLPADVRDDLAMVSRNIELEVRLIADLLDVSRIISGKLHLEKRPLDVADVIREAATIVSGDLDAKGQTLAIHTPGAPYMTLADAARLQQVFWNLLRNAIKFSPPRSQIVVRAHLTTARRCPLAGESCAIGRTDCPMPPETADSSTACQANLVVQVIDVGDGIAPEMLPRLFNAFEQEQKARSFGGLGLGLSICKAVVEMHQGSITAQSDGAGRGATFTVRLPVAQCPAVAAEALPQRHPASEQRQALSRRSRNGRAGRSLRILLVEDHPDTSSLMRRLLLAEGHQVTLAHSVATALAAVENAHPDVLVSDLGLPDGSGMDLLRQLTAQGHRFPAIALSGYGSSTDMQKSREAGFAEHLVKPLHRIETLMEAIARLTVPATVQ